MFEFKLLLSKWKICRTDEREKLLVDGKLCKGSIHYRAREIYISDDIFNDDLGKVIRHELSHAVLYETQLNLNTTYSEEDLCEFMAKYGEFITSKTNEIIKNM